MNAILPLDKKLTVETEVDYRHLDLTSIVKGASNVITPLGPLNTFAARNPWVGLEEQPFEQVARKFKDLHDLDLYPTHSAFQQALNQGEIHLNFLQNRLKQWLDSETLNLDRKVAERFCLAALTQPAKTVSTAKVKKLANKLRAYRPEMSEKHSVKTYSQQLEQIHNNTLNKELDHQIIKWCKLFLDESQAVWSMPNRENGFYQAWRSLVHHDTSLSREVRKILKNLPQEADQALKSGLLALDVPYSQLQDYLEAHLLALPGWAGTMLWRSLQSSSEHSLLTDYLAVRISMEWAFIHPYLPISEQKIEEKDQIEPLIASWIDWGGMSIHAWSQLSPKEIKVRLTLAARFDQITRERLWLEAWEKTYEDHVKTLLTTTPLPSVEETAPLAQFVFCIDVRSEPFRRKLEQAGRFETFGTAGFFGLPIETHELDHHVHHSLPVMFKPKYKVQETSSEGELNKYTQQQQVSNSFRFTFKTMKHNLLSSLFLPEISSPWLSMQMVTRSFIPREAGHAFRKISQTLIRKPTTELSLEHKRAPENELPVGFTDEEKVSFTKQALNMMGLTERFAPLVVICGHSSHSTNNPYASALDCGACGGASSGFNARVLATLCNLPKVRKALAHEGISIPEETVFAAAEHITSLDELRWLYIPALSTAAKVAYDTVNTELPKVSQAASSERITHLPNVGNRRKNKRNEVQTLTEDWSEVRPEWGLARNATFIIGDRRLTRDCDLEGRVFLHNYNWQKDETGSILENIIMGPVTVAQWINLQYYASTVAPHYYGSGNKATQTITSGIGVMQGNASDLLSGLPWQSVMKSDDEFYHAPLRLLVVIHAPRESIQRLLKQHPAFQQKVQNGWIHLASLSPEGEWQSWA
ncbi:DUF2309 family protein [Mesobacillus maritimus]|uniref:Probable inorganic carbon transporter subunit DabA n=2 Tax=Mesobacillus maritimus TaxID=1643336 RepID=A0ABS7K6V6_9BACI|nr:putative inorganic carbon transporter subunit DabA [Mesobacillus maritimus]MBY0098002.1 DUF2309 family protein [Mesobacillus maritimus]